MRAIVCKEFGPPERLVVEEQPMPEITDHQVFVGVKACGEPGHRGLGAPGSGGFAEQIAIDARLCVQILGAMPFDVAAAFLFRYGPSHYALKDRS